MFKGMVSAAREWNIFPEVSAPYVATQPDVYQDMTRPLSHYFISSGHNSYLTGNQLNSKCGTATIVQGLLSGCRVIELDIYHASVGLFGGGAPSLVCKHGGTATAPVLTKVCLEAIAENAFTTSVYPVIITIENHLELEEERELAALLRSTLGDALFVPPAGAVGATWLSPHALQRKILIRTSKKKRKAAEELDAVVYIWAEKLLPLGEMTKLGHTSSSSVGEASLPKVNEFLLLKKTSDDELRTTPGGTMKRAVSKRAPAAAAPPAPKDVDEQNIAPSAHGAGVAAFQEEGAPHESRADAAAAQAGTAAPAVSSAPSADLAVSSSHVGVVTAYQYTGRHLLRTYPAGWRVDSSNYDPGPAWALGACFVALNWQAWDMALWYNNGKFANNGNCGYVLKPEWMREPSEPGCDAALWSLPEREPRRLAVHVYAACKRQSPWKKFVLKDDLYIKMNVDGMPQDRQRHLTNVKQDTGELLVDQTYEISVMFPEVAILLIRLMDEDVGNDTTLCYASIPMATLAEGSFQVPLLKAANGKLKSGQWVKLRFQWLDPPHAVHGSGPAVVAP